jgi:hypothetical protein
LTFRSRSVPLFVVSRKRVGAILHVLSTPLAMVSDRRIFIPVLEFGGCDEIILNVV